MTLEDLRAVEVAAIGYGFERIRSENRLCCLADARQLRAVRSRGRHLVGGLFSHSQGQELTTGAIRGTSAWPERTSVSRGQRYRHVEETAIAGEAIFNVELAEVLQLGADRRLAAHERVGDVGTETGGLALEAADACAGSLSPVICW